MTAHYLATSLSYEKCKFATLNFNSETVRAKENDKDPLFQQKSASNFQRGAFHKVGDALNFSTNFYCFYYPGRESSLYSYIHNYNQFVFVTNCYFFNYFLTKLYKVILDYCTWSRVCFRVCTTKTDGEDIFEVDPLKRQLSLRISFSMLDIAKLYKTLFLGYTILHK